MHRRSLTIVSLVCLLLVAATWIASYFNFHRQGIKYRAALSAGALTLDHTEEWEFYLQTGASQAELDARRAFIDSKYLSWPTPPPRPDRLSVRVGIAA